MTFQMNCWVLTTKATRAYSKMSKKNPYTVVFYKKKGYLHGIISLEQLKYDQLFPCVQVEAAYLGFYSYVQGQTLKVNYFNHVLYMNVLENILQNKTEMTGKVYLFIR